MKIKNKKKIFSFLLILFSGVGLFFLAAPAHAQLADWAGNVVGGLIAVIIGALGIILSLVMQALVAVAQYSNFIKAPAVTYGWTIVRDVCNMFFVLILLIIAFATILKIEAYSWKKWLPKLILMAVLINFSKTICGLLIDFTQVVMLTFVNAFKDIAAGNLVTNLGITEVLTLAQNSDKVGFWAIVGAYFLGLIYIIIALVVVVTMLAMLVMRIVMIWIYVVLSPAAYLLSAFPGGEKYASQWWSEFSKNLIVGPVLAFFIWLSFISLQAPNFSEQFPVSGGDKQAGGDIGITPGTTAYAGTSASTPDVFIKFIIAIGMLIGGLKISQEIGGAAGGIAGKGMAKISSGAAWAGGIATGAALLPWKGAKLAASYGVEKLHQKTGVDLNMKRVWEGVQSKRKEISEKRYTEGQVAASRAMAEGGSLHGVLAMTGNSGDAWEQLGSWRGIKKRIKGGKKMARLQGEGIQEKKMAESDVDRRQMEFDYMRADSGKRDDMRLAAQQKQAETRTTISSEQANIKRIDQEIIAENSRGPILADKNKIEALQKERLDSVNNVSSKKGEAKELQARQKFMNQNYSSTFSKGQLESKEIAIKAAEMASDKASHKIESNIPEYSFEARAAEQKAVSTEASKVKDITDSSELLRIMMDAVKAHDKTMVKAIALKMSKEGNDNEFLKPLAGRTDHIGLKDLMRQFSDKRSDNYAGFTQQESFGLGSQIAEINKGTNHWGATAAYEMENGKWRETTDEEHHNIRNSETSKQQLQSWIRNNNRLAYGYHDKAGKFHLDAGGVIRLKSINSEAGHKNIDTMNESAAKYCYEAIMENKKLQDYFNNNKINGQSLMNILEKRLGKLASEGNFNVNYRNAVDLT